MADLDHLVTGAFDLWHGLPAGTTRVDATDAFGQPDSPADAPRRLATWTGTSRRYAHGIDVWFDGDAVVFVQVDRPQGPALEDMLGPPEAEIPSRLGSSRTQLVWATRGLAAHRSRVTGEVYRLYAFAATDTESFLRSDLAQVEERRIQL